MQSFDLRTLGIVFFCLRDWKTNLNIRENIFACLGLIVQQRILGLMFLYQCSLCKSVLVVVVVEVKVKVVVVVAYQW